MALYWTIKSDEQLLEVICDGLVAADEVRRQVRSHEYDITPEVMQTLKDHFDLVGTS